MHWLDTTLVGLAALVTIPAWVFLGECVLGLLPPRLVAPKEGDAPSIAILIPAHDERLVIAQTVRGLRAQLREEDRIVVVADNCTDETADLARAEGATVVERHDEERRGKGYALDFGMEHLAEDPPEVVVIVDADCAVSTGGIHTIARTAKLTGRPVQAEYLLKAPDEPTPLSVVSALAFLVRNRVRPRGLHRLGLPCHLTGSGMAFPYEVLRDAPATGSYLVEDLLMGIELAIAGLPPLLCTEASVSSDLPSNDRAAAGQRRRWEHGQLLTLIRQSPRLIGYGLLRLRPSLLALGLDLMVPPLALLVLASAMVLLLLTAVTLLAGTTPAAPALMFAALTAIGLGVGLSWLRFGRSTLPFKYVAVIPLYVVWKIPLYLSFFLRKRQKTWERTERSASSTEEP
jgi:cellulose synthase/poly-beta-1,6-N-acetylglucosamine synthase-like glycosyltransferase